MYKEKVAALLQHSMGLMRAHMAGEVRWQSRRPGRVGVVLAVLEQSIFLGTNSLCNPFPGQSVE